MSREELEQKYAEFILPENREPYHFGMPEEFADEVLAHNPMCGDKYRLFIKWDGEVISSLHFHGNGCALSKASASVLAGRVEGMRREEVISFLRKFISRVSGLEDEPFGDEVLDLFVSLREADGREDCICLCWKALAGELSEN